MEKLSYIKETKINFWRTEIQYQIRQPSTGTRSLDLTWAILFLLSNTEKNLVLLTQKSGRGLLAYNLKILLTFQQNISLFVTCHFVPVKISTFFCFYVSADRLSFVFCNSRSTICCVFLSSDLLSFVFSCLQIYLHLLCLSKYRVSLVVSIKLLTFFVFLSKYRLSVVFIYQQIDCPLYFSIKISTFFFFRSNYWPFLYFLSK